MIADRDQLRQLFERTLPPDDVILRQMRAARTRRAKALERAQPGGFWFAAALGGCLALALLITLAFRSLFVPEASDPELRAERLPMVAAPTQSPVLAPPTPRPSEPAEHAAPSPAPHDSVPSRAHKRPPNVVVPKPAPATWEDVARAMREGKPKQADALLSELTQSPDPETRDNARLVQVRSSLNGAAGPARASQRQLETLRQLASSGATASIRASAQKLLAEVEAARAEPTPRGLAPAE